MTSPLPVRVMVEDVWDEVQMELSPGTSVGEIKRQALVATHVRRDPTNYLVKYRGAELSDESRSAEEVGLVPNGALIVLSRRRRAVR